MTKKKPKASHAVAKEGEDRFAELRDALASAGRVAVEFNEVANRMQSALDRLDDATQLEIPVAIKVKAVPTK